MLDKTALVKGLVLAFGGSAAMWTSASLAQDAPANAPEAQRVIVTGSNVRRTDTETPSPVQVITAEDMKQSGYTSVQDVLHGLTANGQGSLSQGFSGAFASGASGVSLRGLTVGATLVLIDGHRSAPYPVGDDGQRSFVDISNIPFDAIDRIEVLKDGASAVYGSDAIAGVVNVILKHSFVGTTLSADVGTSSKGDGGTRHVSATFGMGDLNTDGHNFFIAGEIRKQDQIRYSDRGGSFTKTDYTSTGGFDLTPGVPNALNGGLPRSATGYITDPDGKIIGFMPGCDATKLAAGQCTYHDTWSQIQPATVNYNAIGKYTLRLPADWQLSVEGSYFESKAQQVGNPSRTFTTGYQGTTSGPGVVPALLDTLPATSIPSTNPSFPTGISESSGLLRYTFLDLGPTITDTDARTTRLVTDVDGSFGAWNLSAAAGFSQVKLAVRGHGYVDPGALQTALDSTTDPYLVGGTNSAAVLSAIAPTLVSDDVSRLSFLHVAGGRDLMALGGGQLALALGADYVHRTQNALAPAQIAAGTTPNFSNNYTIGKQDVASVDAELVAPFTHELEGEAQVRYDHYNLSGGKASPKLGFKYTPFSQLAIRGTAGRGFRAPGPAENGTAGQTFFTGATNDDVLCANSDASQPGNFPSECAIQVGTVQSTNPALKPETSKSYTLGFILEPVKDVSASFDFYSIEIDNQIVPGSTTTAIRGTNFTPIPQVQADGSTALVAPPVAPIAYFQAGYVNANTTTTSGVDVDLQLRRRLGEMGDFKSDFMISYMNKYDLKIDGTTYHLAGTHGPLIIGGDTGSPRTRIKWANTWTRGPVEVTATASYIGGYDLTDPSFGVTDCVGGLDFGAGSQAYQDQIGSGVVPSGVTCKVASFTTLDLQGRYEFSKHLSISGSVLNLFNRGAPHDWGTYGGGNAPYNPSLHLAGAIGRYFTAGATYTF